jgi:hypothetical protein
MNRRLVIIFAIALAMALGLPGRAADAGVVRTLDGHVYEGAVSIDPHGYLLVSERSGGQIKVQLDEMLEANFADRADEPTLLRGVALTDGTVLAADHGFGQIDDSSVTCNRSDRRIDVPTNRVARLIFGPVTARQWAKAPPGQTGALLANGDFFQGDFKGDDHGRVKISSVLFGISEFNESEQARAVVLADIRPGAADWVVRFADGSVFLAKDLKLDAGRLLVEDQSLGSFSTDVRGVVSIRRGSNKLVSLADFKPVAIDPNDDDNVAVDGTTCGVAMDLSDCSPTRGIGVVAGTAITYNLEAKYSVFLCRAGVPLGLAPAARLRFIVLVDGREA